MLLLCLSLLPGTALAASADRLAATRGPGQNQPQGVDYGGGTLCHPLGGAGRLGGAHGQGRPGAGGREEGSPARGGQERRHQAARQVECLYILFAVYSTYMYNSLEYVCVHNICRVRLQIVVYVNIDCVYVLTYSILLYCSGRLKKRRRPHVLKIDVEGHDYEVR